MLGFIKAHGAVIISLTILYILRHVTNYWYSYICMTNILTIVHQQQLKLDPVCIWQLSKLQTSGVLNVNNMVPFSGSSICSEALIRITSTGNERLYSPDLYIHNVNMVAMCYTKSNSMYPS